MYVLHPVPKISDMTRSAVSRFPYTFNRDFLSPWVQMKRPLKKHTYADSEGIERNNGETLKIRQLNRRRERPELCAKDVQ
jgi:hypothetical protein